MQAMKCSGLGGSGGGSLCTGPRSQPGHHSGLEPTAIYNIIITKLILYNFNIDNAELCVSLQTDSDYQIEDGYSFPMVVPVNLWCMY